MSEKVQKYRFIGPLLPSSHTRRLIILTGARQTGKTTLVRRQYPELRYINLDAPENREALRAIPSAAWARDVGNAVIDEGQKEPAIFEKIKYAYDEGKISFSLILGSSQILLLKRIRETLAGRAAIYELWPLMMSEIFHNARDQKIPPPPLIDRLFEKSSLGSIFKDIPSILIDKEENLVRDGENYLLRWGGMPALLGLSEEERWKWLRDYEYTYLERDLSDLARLDDLEPFKKFQKLSALRSAKLLHYSELARDSSISVDTARRYLEYLRLSYQVVLLQPYHKNITSSVIKTPKLYWLDVGLLRQLGGSRSELAGEIYETMVVGELVKWIRTKQRNAEIYFYRTRSGLEIDILMETAGGMIGVEIKSGEVIGASDFRSLKEIAKALGNLWRGGLVVYRGNRIEKIADPHIWAVPSRRLFI